MKKFLSVLLIVGFLLLTAVPAYAQNFPQSRYGLTTTPVVNDTASALGAGTWVWGIAIYASGGAGATLGLFDCATLAEVSDTNVKCEVGEAVQYATTTTWFIQPLRFAIAVTAVQYQGIGFIYSGPQP